MLLPHPTSKPRQLPPATDSIVSLCSRGGATRPRSPTPPPARPTGLLSAAPRVPGEPPAHLAPRAPGHCALVATSPGAQLPATSLPETLKWSGWSRAQRTTLSNCFPFYSQAGSWESLSGSLSTLEGRRGCGRGGGGALRAPPRALRRAARAPGSGRCERAAPASPAAAHPAARSPVME